MSEEHHPGVSVMKMKYLVLLVALVYLSKRGMASIEFGGWG